MRSPMYTNSTTMPSMQPRSRRTTRSALSIYLLTGDAELDLLGDAVADFFRQSIVNPTCAQLGGIDHDQWRRSRNRYGQPNQSGEREAGQRGQFENERVLRPEVADYTKSQQEDKSGRGSKRHQSNINTTMQSLAGAAVGALDEVLLIVATHLRSDAGDIVAPAGQNVAND